MPEPDEPELTYEQISVMRLSEDSAVVSIHVEHGLPEEHLEQQGDDESPTPQHYAVHAALHVLWDNHRDSGWSVKDLLADLEHDETEPEGPTGQG
jgi:hypothetical protein